ncbi:hypothetical protein STEG23_030768, partial [Scotinomys teguina]
AYDHIVRLNSTCYGHSCFSSQTGTHSITWRDIRSLPSTAHAVRGPELCVDGGITGLINVFVLHYVLKLLVERQVYDTLGSQGLTSHCGSYYKDVTLPQTRAGAVSNSWVTTYTGSCDVLQHQRNLPIEKRYFMVQGLETATLNRSGGEVKKTKNKNKEHNNSNNNDNNNNAPSQGKNYEQRENVL